MLSQTAVAVKPQVSTATEAQSASPIRPERSGVGVNPNRRSGRIVRNTWDAHERLVRDNPDAVIAYHEQVVAERATGYDLYVAGQSAHACANRTQWGGWLLAKGEYEDGRRSSWSTSPLDTASMTAAQRLGYQDGIAFRSGLEVRNG